VQLTSKLTAGNIGNSTKSLEKLFRENEKKKRENQTKPNKRRTPFTNTSKLSFKDQSGSPPLVVLGLLQQLVDVGSEAHERSAGAH